jgi:hypothetical protein
LNNHHGVWVYAITDHAAGGDISPLTGVAGARVRGAAAAGLTVLVSHVDLAEFGERALRRNLENLEWLEDVARAHHGVIDAAARRFRVLPARFATVYTSEAAMAAALAGHRDELRAGLHRVDGCVELGVKAYAARAAAGTGPADGGTSPGTEATGAGTGMAYLKRRRAELSAQQDSRRAAAMGARAVHAELSVHAAQSRLYPPQSPALSGSRAPMLLNAAYLLDRGSADRFGSAVAASAAAHPELRLDLSGPWPPYSFTARVG